MTMMNKQENRVMDHIRAAYREILDWGLCANEAELAQAVHTMQMFVIMRMLAREEPEEWSEWYDYE